ncbi:MAG: hypothetical protein WCA08_20775 [Desulfoferrobacter sp.]
MDTREVNRVIEDFGRLNLEDKEYVAGVLRRRIIEERREEILQRAQEARESFDRGEVKVGGLQDLYKDLEGA